MDISCLCRGCMKEVASWERQNFDPRGVEMFSFCTNIRITEEDKLPQQFCYDCVIKIEASYTFITEAKKVHVTLKNIISRSDTTIIIQPDSCKPSHNPEMKLTLPDYKICSVIDSRPVLDKQKPLEELVTYEYEEPLIEPDEIFEESTPEVIKSIETITKEINIIEKSKEITNTEINNASENVCPVCRKSFTSKTWFTKHMQKSHSAKKYTCAHCPQSFSRPSQLSYHCVSHSEERRFACGTCGKRFKRRKQLAVHTKAHGDVRPHACDQCPARFKTKSTLQSHMLVHKKDKAFLCSLCGWSFAQAGNLTVHMRVHTGDKPYACALCPFRASAASNMRRHERGHERRPHHACAHCGKPFTDRSNLSRHMRTHTGALPYKCPACAAAFSDSWKRKAHLMRAHKMPLHEIPRMRTDGRLVH